MNIKASFFRQSIFCHFLVLVFFYTSSAANANAVSRPVTDNAYLQQQRQDYILAKKAFQQKNEASYKQLKAKLRNYPLYPYLEYSEIIRQLDQLPYLQIDQFLNKHHGSHLADQLSKRWLQQLAGRKHWRSYKRYYKSELNSTALYCDYLWSRFKTGDKSIYPQVTALWNVGKSQPDNCDKLFNEWQQAGHMTPDIAWKRHRKAIKKRNYSLARYISRRMPKTMQALARLYRRVDRQPKIMVDQSLFKADGLMNRDIIMHGLKKYARSQPKAASDLWQQYRYQYDFTPEERDKLNTYIAIQLARESDIGRATQLAMDKTGSTPRNNVTLITTILRELLRQQQWEDMLPWIERLPEAEKKSERWRYWQARALAHTQTKKTQQTVKNIYRELSLNRSYYGFLAADQIGSNYAFAHKPVAIPNQLTHNVQTIPALQRALELFALGKIYPARHEWAYGVENFSTKQHLAAAQLAANWGWNRKAIESMTAARYWDDLNIRFPLAYTQWVNETSEQIQLPNTLIYAIARQESAWATDALSSAGAVGLMQIMPTTAWQTAKKSGLSYKRKHLFQPKYNITIGSRYIHNLIHRYDGNRLLAVAAYNAGPSRVNRWLGRSNQQLPYDVWIESIPFKETRKYVQNVLTYAVIYGHIMGQSVALITQDEAHKKL